MEFQTNFLFSFPISKELTKEASSENMRSYPSTSMETDIKTIHLCQIAMKLIGERRYPYFGTKFSRLRYLLLQFTFKNFQLVFSFL